MLKNFLLWLMLLACTTTPLWPAPAKARQPSGRYSLPSTVQRPLRLRNTCVAVCSVVDPTPHRPLGFARGSGFFVTPYHVVTCRHLLSVPSPTGLVPADRVIIEWADGRQCDARVVATEKYHDLALLQLEDCRWRGSPVRLAETPLRVGEPVRVAGLFDPSGFWVTEGFVAALNVLDGFAMADAKVRSGFSGGPIFDRDGRLQGMLSQRDDARNAIFVRQDVLRTFLEACGVLPTRDTTENADAVNSEESAVAKKTASFGRRKAPAKRGAK